MSDVERAGVEVYADTSEFDQSMSGASTDLASFGDLASSIGSGAMDILGAGFGAVASIAGGAFTLALDAAGAGLNLLASGIQEGIGSAIEAEQQINGLNRVINNLGDAAPITTDQALGLAESFAGLAGGSDDAVLSIIDLGLKSKKISEAEFPGFIQASLDLGAVIGDNTAAAKLLALAQDDPLAAYSKLERATGVYDSALQAEIKRLQESGDSAGALALVMGSLAATTGGAALENTKTLAGTIELFTGTISEAWETIGAAFLPVLHTFADIATTTLIPAITALAGGFGTFIETLMSGGDIYVAFANFGMTLNTILPGAGDAVMALGLQLDTLFAFIQENIPAIQEMFVGAWAAIQPATQALADVFTVSLLPALSGAFTEIFGQGPTAQEVLTGLLDALSSGAQIAAAWVVDTLVPAVQQFSGWITNDFVPNAILVREWLEVNIPIAIQTLSDFWTNTLMPAVAAVVAFWNDPLVPTFVLIADWLQVNIPAAITVLSDFWNNTLMPAVTATSDYWNNTLLPAFETVQGFIDTSVMPTLTSLGEVIGEVARIVSEVFVLVWNTALEPALKTVSDFITGTVWPAFDELGKLISNTISPAISTFKSDALDPLAGAFSTLAGTLSGVKGWLDDIATALSNIHIPGDLTPGSPTPFEMGLRGIADALSVVNAEMGDLDKINRNMGAIELMAGGASGGTGLERVSMPAVPMGGGVIYNNNVTQHITTGRYMSPPDMGVQVRQGLSAAVA